MEILWNEDLVRKIFVQAAEIVLKVSKNDLHRDNIRTEPFTKLIKRAGNNFVNSALPVTEHSPE